jgi:hypothetical protein
MRFHDGTSYVFQIHIILQTATLLRTVLFAAHPSLLKFEASDTNTCADQKKKDTCDSIQVLVQSPLNTPLQSPYFYLSLCFRSPRQLAFVLIVNAHFAFIQVRW